VVKSIAETQYIRRIESQLILFGRRPGVCRARAGHVYEREFWRSIWMCGGAPEAQRVADSHRALGRATTRRRGAPDRGAYVGHIDSQINDSTAP